MTFRGLSLGRPLRLALLMVLIPPAALGPAQAASNPGCGRAIQGPFPAPAGRDESPLQDPAAPKLSADEVISSLLENNRLREGRLRQYSVTRTYQVTNPSGGLVARTIASMEFRAPASKVFTTHSEEGSWVARRLVFRRLMESEAEAAAGRARQESVVGPGNYTFTLLGEEDVGGFHCIVVNAVPRRRDKYLFEGKVWIDSEDRAVVRIVGEPAKSPSFWIKHVNFVRQYQKIGEFWLPERDESENELKIHGKRILTIEHRDYRVNGVEAKGDQSR